MEEGYIDVQSGFAVHAPQNIDRDYLWPSIVNASTLIPTERRYDGKPIFVTDGLDRGKWHLDANLSTWTRDIVSTDYTDTHIASQPVQALVKDPTVTEDGYHIAWNFTSGFYELVAPSAGVTDHTLLSNIGSNTHAQIDTHLALTSGNPHQVTFAQLAGTNPTTLSGYGISDTKVNFNTALSDGTFLYVGDYGLGDTGANPAPNDDWNDVAAMGFYTGHTGTSNSWAGGSPSFLGMIHVNAYVAASNSFQISTGRSSASPLYLRHQSNDVWSSWVALHDFNSISQAEIDVWNNLSYRFQGQVTDMNDAHYNGFVDGTNSGLLNPPTGWSTFVSGFVSMYSEGSSGSGWQLMSNRSASSVGIQFRGYANGVWAAWKKVWTDIDFSQTDVDNWDDAFSWNDHALAGYEPGLGNPDVDGKILSSTIAGVRSWITPPSGVTDHTLLSNIGTNTHAQIDTHIALTNAHIDWTLDQGATNIHAGNYIDTNTTDHTLFSNIGTNTHAQIDTHIALTNAHLDWTLDQGATNIHTGNYINTIFTPDTLLNDYGYTVPTGNQIIDWSLSQTPNIHANNYTDTTYAADQVIDWTVTNAKNIHADNYTNTTYGANQVLDWTVSQGATNIHADNYINTGDTTDHTALSNIGTNTHPQIDTHIGLVNNHLDWSIAQTPNIHSSNYTNTTYAANQVLDWTVSQGATDIHADNYTNTTYGANQVLDWTLDQGSTNIHSGNYTNTNDIDYISGGSWNSGSGLLSLTGAGNAGMTLAVTNLETYLNANLNFTNNPGTLTGTGANDYVAVWTGTSALEGTTALRFSSNHVLGISDTGVLKNTGYPGIEFNNLGIIIASTAQFSSYFNTYFIGTSEYRFTANYISKVEQNNGNINLAVGETGAADSSVGTWKYGITVAADTAYVTMSYMQTAAMTDHLMFRVAAGGELKSRAITGTASATTYLRGDGSWTTPDSGGGSSSGANQSIQTSDGAGDFTSISGFTMNSVGIVLNGATSANLTLDRNSTANDAHILYYTNGSSNWAVGQGVTDATTFEIWNNGTPSAAALLIDYTTNNIGIGTAPTAAKLQIGGAISVGGSILSTANITGDTIVKTGGTGSQILMANGTVSTNPGGWLTDIVQDTSPQLGGNLSLNSKYITETQHGDPSLAVSTIGTGNWYNVAGSHRMVNGSSASTVGEAEQSYGFVFWLGTRDQGNGYGAIWSNYAGGGLWHASNTTGADPTWGLIPKMDSSLGTTNQIPYFVSTQKLTTTSDYIYTPTGGLTLTVSDATQYRNVFRINANNGSNARLLIQQRTASTDSALGFYIYNAANAAVFTVDGIDGDMETKGQITAHRSAEQIILKGTSNTTANIAYLRFQDNAGVDQGYMGYGSGTSYNYYVYNALGGVYIYANNSISATFTSGTVTATNFVGNASTATWADTVDVNNNNNANSNYYVVWHSGDSVYSTNGVTIHPLNNTISASNFIDASDVRKKKGVKRIDRRWVDNHKHIKPIQYRLKVGDNKLQFGVVAQDLLPYYPDLVTTADDGMLGVNYRSLAMLNLLVTQDHETRIQELEKELAELKSQN